MYRRLSAQAPTVDGRIREDPGGARVSIHSGGGGNEWLELTREVGALICMNSKPGLGAEKETGNCKLPGAFASLTKVLVAGTILARRYYGILQNFRVI